MNIDLTYLDDLARVHIDMSDVAATSPVRVERSLNEMLWMTVRGGADVSHDGSFILDDFEFFADMENHYRVTAFDVGAHDTFARVESNGWGTADTGQVWSASGGAAGDYSVDGSAGLVELDTVSVARFTELPGEFTDGEVVARVSVDVEASGAAISPGVALRFQDEDNFYLARPEFLTNGNVQLSILKWVGGSVSGLGTESLGSYSADEEFDVAFAAIGDQLTAKLTRVSNGEAVDVSAVDDAHTGPGVVATRSLLFPGNDNTLPVTLSYHELRRDSFDDDPMILDQVTDSITPDLDGHVWLKSIQYPSLNRPVITTEYSDQTRASRSAVFDVVGRSAPIAVHDVRAGKRFDLEITTSTLTAARDIDLVLASGSTFFIHVPAGCPVPGGYVEIGTVSQVRRSARTVRRFFTLPCQTVTPPPPDVVGTTLTWGTVERLYTSWEQLVSSNPTWADLLATVGDPEDLVVL